MARSGREASTIYVKPDSQEILRELRKHGVSASAMADDAITLMAQDPDGTLGVASIKQHYGRLFWTEAKPLQVPPSLGFESWLPSDVASLFMAGTTLHNAILNSKPRLG